MTSGFSILLQWKRNYEIGTVLRKKATIIQVPDMCTAKNMSILGAVLV